MKDTRKTPGKWSDEDVAKVRELIADKVGSTQIGKVFGVSRCAIIGLCHRKSIKLPGANGRGNALGPTRLKRLQQSVNQGKAQHEIAAELGVTQSCISKHVRRKNLKPRARSNKQTVPRAPLPADWQQAFNKSGYKAVFAEGTAGQTGRVGFQDLDRYHCRFPIDQPTGEVRYCGKRARDCSRYCETHHAICNTPHVRRSTKERAS